MKSDGVEIPTRSQLNLLSFDQLLAMLDKRPHVEIASVNRDEVPCQFFCYHPRTKALEFEVTSGMEDDRFRLSIYTPPTERLPARCHDLLRALGFKGSKSGLSYKSIYWMSPKCSPQDYSKLILVLLIQVAYVLYPRIMLPAV